MTLLWFFIWLVCNLIGDKEVLTFDPVNCWPGHSCSRSPST